jgi:hypothetical protein
VEFEHDLSVFLLDIGRRFVVIEIAVKIRLLGREEGSVTFSLSLIGLVFREFHNSRLSADFISLMSLGQKVLAYSSACDVFFAGLTGCVGDRNGTH